MLTNAVWQRLTVILEIFISTGIDHLFGFRCNRTAATTRRTSAANARSSRFLESASRDRRLDLLKRKNVGDIRRGKFIGFRMQQVIVAVERHQFAGCVGYLIIWAQRGSSQAELDPITVGRHLRQYVLQEIDRQSIDLAVPALASLRVQNVLLPLILAKTNPDAHQTPRDLCRW